MKWLKNLFKQKKVNKEFLVTLQQSKSGWYTVYFNGLPVSDTLTTDLAEAEMNFKYVKKRIIIGEEEKTILRKSTIQAV